MNELFHPHEVDIKSLAVEAPRQETSAKFFDPLAEMDPLYRKMLLTTVEQSVNNKSWEFFLPRARHLQILDPEFVQSLLTGEARESLLHYGRSATLHPDELENLIIVCPELRQDLGFDSQNDVDYRDWVVDRDRPILNTYRESLLRFKIRYPNRFLEAYPDTDEHWHKMSLAMRAQGLSHRVKTLAVLKQIDPIRAQNLSLTDEELQAADRELHPSELYADPIAYEFPANLKIIAAESVVIDTDGIRLIMPSEAPGQAASPSLPEQRRY